MIAALRQNALPIAMILVCAAALYLVYRDMKKIDARLNRLDAAVVVLAEEQHAGETCAVHDGPEAFDDYEAALIAEDDLEDLEVEPAAEPVAEPAAEPVSEPAAEPVSEPVPEAQA
jgi:signal transduction histidine kinase